MGTLSCCGVYLDLVGGQKPPVKHRSFVFRHLRTLFSVTPLRSHLCQKHPGVGCTSSPRKKKKTGPQLESPYYLPLPIEGYRETPVLRIITQGLFGRLLARRTREISFQIYN